MKSLRSSLLFSAGTFLSRIFGLVRESVIAGTFGATVGMDAFLIANRIPNMLREMLAEGALGSSFTKVYSETLEKDRNKANKLFNDTLLFFLIVSIIIITLGIIFAPILVDSMTLIKSSENKDDFIKQSIGLTKLLFPFIGMMILGSIASGVLHQSNKFFVSSISPIALNIGYLLGALVFSQLLLNHGPSWIEKYFADRAITGLAFGVLFGGFLQCLLQFWSIRKIIKINLPISFTRLVKSKELKKVLLLMGPMVIASSAGQINIFINTNFATSLETGAITWLTFSFRLLQLPIGIFAVAASSVALPKFTRLISLKKSKSQISLELFQMNEFMLWLMFPCFIFLQFNSYEVITLLFGHGNFTLQDITKTSEALYFYSFGLIGYGLIKLLTSFYYALDRTNYAMKVSLMGILINYFLNYLLVEKFGFHGLAMSSSILLTFNAIGLLLGLYKELINIPKIELFMFSLCISVSCLLTYLLHQLTHQFLSSESYLQSMDLKAQSFIILTINGFFTVLSFLFFGWKRVKKIYYKI